MRTISALLCLMASTPALADAWVAPLDTRGDAFVLEAPARPVQTWGYTERVRRPMIPYWQIRQPQTRQIVPQRPQRNFGAPQVKRDWRK